MKHTIPWKTSYQKWYKCKTDTTTNTKKLEIDPYKYSKLIFHKAQMQSDEERIVYMSKWLEQVDNQMPKNEHKHIFHNLHKN